MDCQADQSVFTIIHPFIEETEYLYQGITFLQKYILMPFFIRHFIFELLCIDNKLYSIETLGCKENYILSCKLIPLLWFKYCAHSYNVNCMHFIAFSHAHFMQGWQYRNAKSHRISGVQHVRRYILDTAECPDTLKCIQIMVVLTNCKCQIKQAVVVTTTTMMKIKHLSIQVRDNVKTLLLLKDL
jgi:hypothetical protein